MSIINIDKPEIDDNSNPNANPKTLVGIDIFDNAFRSYYEMAGSDPFNGNRKKINVSLLSKKIGSYIVTFHTKLKI